MEYDAAFKDLYYVLKKKKENVKRWCTAYYKKHKNVV